MSLRIYVDIAGARSVWLPAVMDEGFTVYEVADRVGISVYTVYVWRRKGLIPLGTRMASNITVYTPDEVERIAAVARERGVHFRSRSNRLGRERRQRLEAEGKLVRERERERKDREVLTGVDADRGASVVPPPGA